MGASTCVPSALRSTRILRRRLAQRLDALGAQNLLDDAAILHDGHFLQVGLEVAIGGALRE